MLNEHTHNVIPENIVGRLYILVTLLLVIINVRTFF